MKLRRAPGSQQPAREAPGRVEVEKPRSIQQKPVHHKGGTEVSQHSAEDCAWQNLHARAGTPAQQCKRTRDGTREVLPRTTTTTVVLKASADHTVVESSRREDRAVSDRLSLLQFDSVLSLQRQPNHG